MIGCLTGILAVPCVPIRTSVGRVHVVFTVYKWIVGSHEWLIEPEGIAALVVNTFYTWCAKSNELSVECIVATNEILNIFLWVIIVMIDNYVKRRQADEHASKGLRYLGLCRWCGFSHKIKCGRYSLFNTVTRWCSKGIWNGNAGGQMLRKPIIVLYGPLIGKSYIPESIEWRRMSFCSGRRSNTGQDYFRQNLPHVATAMAKLSGKSSAFETFGYLP